MRLAVVIVSYNVCTLLRNCLHSVLTARASDWLAIDVVVVDNASGDGSAAMVAAEFPEVNLLALDQNLGFTGANNLALHALGFPVTPARSPSRSLPSARCVPDLVLLLNPDTEVVGNALETMAIFLATRPGAGACGAALQYAGGRFQHGAFRFPTLSQAAIDFFPLTGVPGAHRLHDSWLNGRYPADLWQGNEPFEVDFVLGAAMMLRSEAICAVGGLDDAYWMYCEEIDWCLRLRERGWRVYALPAAHVVHYEGQSSCQVRWLAYERLWRSRFRFYARHRAHYPAGYLAALRLLVRLGLANRRRQAWSAFGRGMLTGVQLAEELAAYAAIQRL